MKRRQINRGDIYYADLNPVVGSEQGGMRPVINIQNEVGNRHSPTIIVAAITSKPKTTMPTHVALDGIRGLEKDSVVLLEQLRTIDKKRLLEYIGTAEEAYMQKIDLALCTSIEIRQPENPMLVSLCSVCANQFYSSKEHYIRRVDMNQVEKETCVLCNVRRGYDFIVNRRIRYRKNL